MKTQALPKLYDLRESSAATGGKITVSRLRAAVRSGELACHRITDSCSGKILIDENDLAAWLGTLRGRGVVPSPSEVHAANLTATD